MFISAARTGLACALLLTSSVHAEDPKPATAPDYSKDKFPPYPGVTKDGSVTDGSFPSTLNLRPTRLFGWKGCEKDDTNAIAGAYNDFYTLSQQSELWDKIDWNSQAAKDFWGPASGRNALKDERKTEIGQIYKAAQQIYSRIWSGEPPWIPNLKSLWIEVACSGGDGTGDPDNVCQDKKPDDPGRCPPRNGQPGQPLADPVQGSLMEAWSDPTGTYSKITFCNRFFNELKNLAEVTKAAKALPANKKTSLEYWNGRARCFFHEITHLTYFMNTPGKGPNVDDYTIKYKEKGRNVEEVAYGVYNAKILRNYMPQGKSGYYPQRNGKGSRFIKFHPLKIFTYQTILADNYAFFAMAKYAEKQLGMYPNLPNPGSKKPTSAPQQGKDPVVTGETFDQGTDDLLGSVELDQQEIPDFKIPKCYDNYPGSSASGAGTSPAPIKADPKCDTKALSGVPFNVFHGSAGNVYDKFCDAVGKDQKTKLTWNVNAKGDLKPKRRRSKRTPPPNPDGYDSYNFELNWAPAGSAACSPSCKDAFASIANSPCGHQGGQQNGMTAAASLDVGCGSYSYKITGKDVPAVEGPPKPFLSAQYCFPSDVFGKHGDINGDFQAQYTGWACAGSALKTIKKGDPSTFVKWETTTNGVPYSYNIYWKDKCESAVNEANLFQPYKEIDANCLTMLQNDYKKCGNGGIGGSVSVGCIVYEFKAKLGGPWQP
ncbi:MAG: hypothetical protein M1814_001156 [Vezdaea aestivalis]|nr:MAG: hypothetical protein M1814_001156 [Vezdaea aestivalis]